MDQTPNLQLSLMAHKQGQRSTYHDDALKALDTLVMLSVIDRDLSSPPVAPEEGDRYIVKAPGSGHDAWLDDHVAVFIDGDWLSHEPQLGWTCYVQDEGALLAWDGAAWQPAINVMSAGLELQELARLGIATTADATNPFAAKLNNVLFAARILAEGGDGDLRYKLSKESAANTLSFLFQDNFSGRAEIGLAGDDDFHFKVSPDGAAWLDALRIDRTTGKLAIGQGFADTAAARGKLYAAPFDALAFNGMQVNGNIDVSQELGVTGATLASGTAKYTADMWQARYVHGAGTAVVTSGQVAAASFPVALPGYSCGHQIKATTALSAPANGDYAMHRHAVEGYRVARLGWGAAGAQPLAYGFNFYASVAGTIFVKVCNADGSRNHYVEHAVVSGWTWIAGSIAGDTTGTWHKSGSAGLVFDIFSAGKAAAPVAPGAWTATSTTQTTNSTSLLGSTNNLTIVAGLVLLPGIELPQVSHAPLIMRPFQEELLLCQRHWEKGYRYDDAPGAASVTGNGMMIANSSLAGSTAGNVGGPNLMPFKAEKRINPSVVVYDYDGTANAVRIYPMDAKRAGVTLVANPKAHGIVQFFSFDNSSGTAISAGNQLAYAWTANARL